MNILKYHKNKKGFAMLFTVLIISLVLSIAIGISNASLKQYILSSLVKDSQLAFNEADSAVECGVLYDFSGFFPKGLPEASAPATINCGSRVFTLDGWMSYTDYLVYRYTPPSLNQSCSMITFQKLIAGREGTIEGRGYNMCDALNPRSVQRALQVTY